MTQFRKKPVVIDAVQLTWGNWNEICEFVTPKYFGGGFNPDGDSNRIGLKINTLEGTMFAEQDDWIIKGVNGEFYSCKPDIFEKTYQKADESPDELPQYIKDRIDEKAMEFFRFANKQEIIFDLGWKKIFEAGAQLLLPQLQQKDQLLETAAFNLDALQSQIEELKSYGTNLKKATDEYSEIVKTQAAEIESLKAQTERLKNALAASRF